MNRVKKFIKLINKRDNLIESHCNGESWAELCNYPEERDWYCENIVPLDNQIIIAANGIIAKFSIPCKEQRTIKDVYNNQWLINLYNKHSSDSKEK